MKYTSEDAEMDAIMGAANDMAAAARTAPKGCGIDNIEVVVLDGDDKGALAAEMRKLAEERGTEFFARDAGNVDASGAIVLIGVRDAPIGLQCGVCGFEGCAGAVKAGSRCAFNVLDLGIALGSAASVAMDRRIDNRVMYTAGQAALRLPLFSEKVGMVCGIPLSTSGKSIFFDRG